MNNLPVEYWITPEPDSDFFQQLEQRLTQDVSLIQLRAKSLNSSDYIKLAEKVLLECQTVGAKLILNADAKILQQIPAPGLHLCSKRLLQCEQRPVSHDHLLSAACHNLSELQHAQQLGADLALLSPVNKTLSHPQAKPIGWDQFAELAAQVSLPVYALGGIKRTDLNKAQRFGAYGIAYLRG